jgi:hypothetical protein
MSDGSDDDGLKDPSAPADDAMATGAAADTAKVDERL